MNTATIKTHSPLALAALGFVLTVAGFALATTASAEPWNYARRGSYGTPAHNAVEGNVVDVLVKVDGTNAPLFFKPGTTDRHYFQAYQGRNYSLVVRNTTGRRIGVVISVDGLNVVNGERSSLNRHEQHQRIQRAPQEERHGPGQPRERREQQGERGAVLEAVGMRGGIFGIQVQAGDEMP